MHPSAPLTHSLLIIHNTRRIIREISGKVGNSGTKFEPIHRRLEPSAARRIPHAMRRTASKSKDTARLCFSKGGDARARSTTDFADVARQNTERAVQATNWMCAVAEQNLIQNKAVFEGSLTIARNTLRSIDQQSSAISETP